jgi:hypothetical protein
MPRQHIKGLRAIVFWWKAWSWLLPLWLMAYEASFLNCETSSMVFGRWDPELDFEQLSLSKTAAELQSKAPVFTYLITELARNQRKVDNTHNRMETTGYTVMVASILLLKFSRNSANAFTRMLGLYLQGSGIKRRVMSVENEGLAAKVRTSCQLEVLGKLAHEYNSPFGYCVAHSC